MVREIMNPASFSVDGPLSATADFEVIYAIAATRLSVPAATPLEVRLRVENGVEPTTWRILSGSLPLGTRLSGDGVISGAALEMGSFQVGLEATDSRGLPASATLELDLTAPSLSIEQLTSTFLKTGADLTDAQITFLNFQGNRVAPYDIGDFRAWILANPRLPFAAEVGTDVHRETVTLGATERTDDSTPPGDPDGGEEEGRREDGS